MESRRCNKYAASPGLCCTCNRSCCSSNVASARLQRRVGAFLAVAAVATCLLAWMLLSSPAKLRESSGKSSGIARSNNAPIRSTAIVPKVWEQKYSSIALKIFLELFSMPSLQLQGDLTPAVERNRLKQGLIRRLLGPT
eukprot:6189296-Pleurochrysis_carterae.AAC.1